MLLERRGSELSEDVEDDGLLMLCRVEEEEVATVDEGVDVDEDGGVFEDNSLDGLTEYGCTLPLIKSSPGTNPVVLFGVGTTKEEVDTCLFAVAVAAAVVVSGVGGCCCALALLDGST